MKKTALVIVILLSITRIFAQGIDYEHLHLSEKELNNLLLNNSVDIVFSSGVLLSGAVICAGGTYLLYETYKVEYEPSDSDEPYDGEPDIDPNIFIFLMTKGLGYSVGGFITLGGLTIATIGLSSLSKSIQINKRLRNVKINLQDMSVAGKPGMGIEISIPLN